MEVNKTTRPLLVLGALALFACGNTVNDKPAPDAGDDASDDQASDATNPVPVACGATTCAAGDFCILSCTGNPAYCDAPDDAGVCPSGEHLATSCQYGPGAQLDGGGCSNVAYGSSCKPLSPGQTTYACPGNGLTEPIDSNGVVHCCFD